MKLKTVKVGNTNYDVHVNNDGNFYATREGGTESIFMRGSANPWPETEASIPKLVERLTKRERAKRIKINVPFVKVSSGGGKLTDTYIHGKHKTEDRWLGRVVGGDAEKFDNYELYGSSCYRPMTDEQKAEYARLSTAIREANEARDNFVGDNKLEYDDLRTVLERTWNAAVNAAPEVKASEVNDIDSVLTERRMEVKR